MKFSDEWNLINEINEMYEKDIRSRAIKTIQVVNGLACFTAVVIVVVIITAVIKAIL